MIRLLETSSAVSISGFAGFGGTQTGARNPICRARCRYQAAQDDRAVVRRVAETP
jgi:hypothetical protein